MGTLAVFWHGLQSGNEARAITLAFTTFVLFQFFNVFNARAETGSAFAQHLFGNRMLWLALAAVLALQIVVVHWEPAQTVFRTTALGLADWGVAAMPSPSITRSNGSLWLIIDAILSFSRGMAATTSGISVG